MRTGTGTWAEEDGPVFVMYLDLELEAVVTYRAEACGCARILGVTPA
jgi:hypothetical protein